MTLRHTGLLVLSLLTGVIGTLTGQRQPRGGGSKLPAPSGVTVSSNATALTVSWTNVTGATQYTVNRQEGGSIVALASGLAGSPYTGPLPNAGVAYQYQVVAMQITNGKVNTAPSEWVTYTVPYVVPPSGTGTIITEPRPVGTPTIVPAGPASLTTGSTIPGQIHLTWSAVTNATGYRVTRSTATAAEAVIGETPVGQYYYNNAPVAFDVVYSYRVYALFASSTGVTVSTPSPVASLTSTPFVQAEGLKVRPNASTTPGHADVTFSWIGKAGIEKVEKFVVWNQATGAVLGYPTVKTLIQPDVPSGPTYTTYSACVAAIYPYGVRMDGTGSCTQYSVIAGPAQVTAVSLIPGQIKVRWGPVNGAAYYRIRITNSGGLVSELILAPVSSPDGWQEYTFPKVDFRWTYTYQVNGVFEHFGERWGSASSPIASAVSLPFVQVTGLTFGVVPSTTTLGRLNVTLSWSAVSDVEKYLVYFDGGVLLGSTTSTSHVVRDVPPGWSGRVCVGAQYPYDLQQPNTAPCVDIRL